MSQTNEPATEPSEGGPDIEEPVVADAPVGHVDDAPPTDPDGLGEHEVIYTETIRYVRVPSGEADLASALGPATPQPVEKGLSPGLAALGLFVVAALIAYGWFLGTRSAEQEVEAVIAALPDTERKHDDFERSTPTALGDDSEDGLLWSSLGARFVADQGQAVVEDSTTDGDTGLALTDTEWSDATIGITASQPVAGGGLVFRFSDVFNYWSLVAAPEFGTWNLVLTVDGAPTRTESVGLTDTDPDTQVTVSLNGPEISVFVNGSPVATIIDPTFELGTSAGLIAPAGSGAGYSEFFAVENTGGAAGG